MDRELRKTYDKSNINNLLAKVIALVARNDLQVALDEMYKGIELIHRVAELRNMALVDRIVRPIGTTFDCGHRTHFHYTAEEAEDCIAAFAAQRNEQQPERRKP